GDLAGRGRGRRLVRPGARARRGRRDHDALPPHRRPAVPDGAEHRAGGRTARPQRGGVTAVATGWSPSRRRLGYALRSPARDTHARFVEAVHALAEDQSAVNVARYLRASTALERALQPTPRRTPTKAAA